VRGAGAARASRLAPHSAGIEATDEGDSIALTLSGGRGFERLTLRVDFDGSVVAEGPVGGDEQGFGGMLVVADRAREVIERAVAFAEAVWQRIDSRDEVRDVFLACAVPEANHKVYALEPAGGSLGMGMGGPHMLIAPEPPLAARRADRPLGHDAAVDRLQTELHRAFELLSAVHPRARPLVTHRTRLRMWYPATARPSAAPRWRAVTIPSPHVAGSREPIHGRAEAH
jgi:hypothetical protein